MYTYAYVCVYLDLICQYFVEELWVYVYTGYLSVMSFVTPQSGFDITFTYLIHLLFLCLDSKELTGFEHWEISLLRASPDADFQLTLALVFGFIIPCESWSTH